MGWLKKIFKPVSKVLDKIVPNEVKPFLPYAAAFAPMLAPGMFGSAAGGLGSLLGGMNPIASRALLGGGLNALSQLSQEGNEGNLNWMSTGLGALSGAMTGSPADYKYDAMRAPGANSATMLEKAKMGGMDFLGKGNKIYNTGMDKLGFNMDTLKMAALPASTAIGDSMAFEGNAAMREYERALAEYNTEQGAMGNDAGRREAILAAMRAYNHPEDLIESTLAELGLRDGGRVGLEFGGIPAAVQNIQNKTAEDDMKLAENMDIDWQTLAEEFEITFKRPHSNDKELFDFYRNKYGFNGDVSENVEIEETMTAADGGIMNLRPGYVSGGGIKAAWTAAKAMKNKVVNFLSKMTDDVEITTATDYATDTGASMDLSIVAKSRKGKNTLDGLVEEGIMTKDGNLYHVADDMIGDATAGMGDNLKVSGVVEEGIDFKRFDEGAGLGVYDMPYAGYDEIIENFKPKKAGGGIMNSPQTYHQYHDQTPPLNLEGLMGYNTGGSVLPQGMEMDYRGGGMIPEGSQERADDVPARVSKNEFVMTADAVRAAGGGSVNQGAKKMYNLMNNLEARA